MPYVLAGLGVYFIITSVNGYVVAPSWYWSLFTLALGIGAACLIDVSHWWLGIGVAGGASLLKVFDALLLSAGDRARMEVLRNTRNKEKPL